MAGNDPHPPIRLVRVGRGVRDALGTPCPEKSSFEGGQPCERVQRSKAGGCQPRKAIPDAPSKPKPSPYVMPMKMDASGATDEVNPGSTTSRTNYLT